MTLSVPINYLQSPVFIANQGLDLIGASNMVLGDISDGSPIAEVVRRNYGQLLRQLLRTAHWGFARKRARLNLLGDAYSATPPPGVSSDVEPPWGYAYEWPIDGVMGRWLPWTPPNGSPVSSTGVPLTTGNSAPLQYWSTPGRFLVSSSDKYPVEVGDVPWDQQPDLQRTFGVGPTVRQVILTDCCNAEFVYTAFIPVIEQWDALFRQAMVSLLALSMIPTAISDPNRRLAERDRMIKIAKNAIDDARVATGNEAGFPQTTDTTPDWILARNWGGYGSYGYGGGASVGGVGYFYCGWETMSWGGGVF